MDLKIDLIQIFQDGHIICCNCFHLQLVKVSIDELTKEVSSVIFYVPCLGMPWMLGSNNRKELFGWKYLCYSFLTNWEPNWGARARWQGKDFSKTVTKFIFNIFSAFHLSSKQIAPKQL